MGAGPSHTARAQRLRHRRQAAPKSPNPRLCFATPRSDMKPEDMEKWASRAQTVAAYSKKPMAAYQGCRSMLAKAGAGGLLAGVMAILAVISADGTRH